MESKGITSQLLGNDVLGDLMARIEALGRDMKGEIDAMRRDVKSDMDAMKSEMSTFSGRLDCVESRRNSRPSTPNPYYASSSAQAQ